MPLNSAVQFTFILCEEVCKRQYELKDSKIIVVCLNFNELYPDISDSVNLVEQRPYPFSIPERENIRLRNLASSGENINRLIKELGIEALVDRNISMSNSELSRGEKSNL